VIRFAPGYVLRAERHQNPVMSLAPVMIAAHGA
jgi:hypothetical protein